MVDQDPAIAEADLRHLLQPGRALGGHINYAFSLQLCASLSAPMHLYLPRTALPKGKSRSTNRHKKITFMAQQHADE